MDRGAVAFGLADLGDRALFDAADELLAVKFALAAHVNPQFRGKRIHHRGADAVQTAGNLVGLAAELGPGVQRGHHRFQRRDLGLRMDVNGDAASVVGDRDVVALVDRGLDGIAETGHRLVDAVVDHLVDQVVQAALVGGADVHAGAAADRLPAVQHVDVRGVVITGAITLRFSGHRHASAVSIRGYRSGCWQS